MCRRCELFTVDWTVAHTQIQATLGLHTRARRRDAALLVPGQDVHPYDADAQQNPQSRNGCAVQLCHIYRAHVRYSTQR
jgi:hypothetical protein